MKTIQALLLSMSVAFTASADTPFNTIEKRPSLYKILTDTDTSHIEETVSATDEKVRENNDNIEAVRYQRREDLVRQYLSVSLPLDQISLSSPYGMRNDPIERGKRTMHKGIDLKARYNEVYAMMYGKVIKVGSEKKGGKFVTIQHGDYTISYCHLSEQLVTKGQWVLPGDVVAISGNTGTRTTGPHLHITARHNGKHIDPALVLEYVTKTREEALAGLQECN